MNKNVYAIVLAAGKGTRMKSDKPKVLHDICGRPMLTYTLDLLDKLGLKSVVVVGYQKEEVMKLFGDKYLYAVQEEQLGTAHAVQSAKSQIPKDASTILVLNGDDSAFYKSETLEKLVKKHLEDKNVITFLSLQTEDPEGFGRVKRNQNDKVQAIVEDKNATEAEKQIKEINLGTYCFDADFLWEALPQVAQNKVAQEYYLPDVIALAIKENQKIGAIKIEDTKEWFGINTKEQLEQAQSLMQRCQNTKN